MAEWLQVSITAVSITITVALLVRQLHRARKQIRVRPRLDVVRIAVQLAAVIVVASLLGTGAPIAALIMLAALAAIPGYVQGRNLEITDTDGRLYAARNTVAAGVWATGLVLMQTAGLLRRTGILSFGQATAWIGVGLAVGLFVGRRGPIADYRRAVVGAAVPVGAVGLLALSLFAIGRSHDAAAQEIGDRWVLVNTVVNPDDAEAPDGWDLSMSTSSMTAIHGFGAGDDSGAAATFDASWTPPPATLVPGETLTIPTTVSGSVTGNRETQFFFGLHVIMIVDGRWNDQAVSAGANCAQTTVISGEYVCSEPETSTGELTTTVPSWGDEFTVGVGALNCGGACYVGWEYELDAAADTSGAGSDEGTAGSDDDGEVADDDGGGGSDATGDQPSDVDLLDDFIEQAKDDTGIEPDEAMQAAIAGVIAALATGGISLVEAMDQITRIFDEGGGVEREPQVRLADPVMPDDLDEGGVGDTLVEDDRPPGDSSVARTGSEFEDELADYVNRLPPPGEGADIDEFLDWLERMGEAARGQVDHWNRPVDLDEIRRVWDALSGAATDPSAATADELRNALADLLDRNPPGVPTWLVSWAMRNPAAAAEMTIRMGAAFYTGGASELVLIPWDVNRDITAARDAAVARGEDFTFGDGLIAGAQGQVVGWIVDGAGAVANAQRRAAGETLAEIAARTQARAGADALEEGVETGLERMGRSVDPEDLANAARRNTDADAWRGMQNEPPGSKIPPEHIRETGYTPQQASELQRVAAEQNVIIGTRETNLDSTRWIEAGDAIPKPMAVKAKTVNELDALIGGPPADKKGLVGFFEPTEPPMPRSQNPELWARYDARAAEWKKLGPEMQAMESAGYQVRDGVVSKVLPDGTTKPFAGDIDAVAILDRRTGRPLSGDRYQEVVDELRRSGAMLQHGAETNVVNDIVAHETRGLVRGTREYNEAFDRAMDKAQDLGRKLDQNHLSGSEQVFWTHEGGHYRGPQLNRLSQWQAMTAGEIPNRIVDPTEIAATLRPVTRAIDRDTLTPIDTPPE